MESQQLHQTPLLSHIYIYSLVLYVAIHYPITLLILVVEIPLTSMTISQSLCHLSTPYMIIY